MGKNIIQYVLDTTIRKQTQKKTNKTWALIQTTGGKDEPNIVFDNGIYCTKWKSGACLMLFYVVIDTDSSNHRSLWFPFKTTRCHNSTNLLRYHITMKFMFISTCWLLIILYNYTYLGGWSLQSIPSMLIS
jgi:hypothetical protein